MKPKSCSPSLRGSLLRNLCTHCSWLLCAAAFAAPPDTFFVRDFGAKGDGRTDDTAAFQKVLEVAAQNGGGTVQAGRGNFLFAGHLSVPSAVTLEGVWKSVPAHNGLRDRGLPKPTDDGTTFLSAAPDPAPPLGSRV